MTSKEYLSRKKRGHHIPYTCLNCGLDGPPAPAAVPALDQIPLEPADDLANLDDPAPLPAAAPLDIRPPGPVIEAVEPEEILEPQSPGFLDVRFPFVEDPVPEEPEEAAVAQVADGGDVGDENRPPVELPQGSFKYLPFGTKYSAPMVVDFHGYTYTKKAVYARTGRTAWRCNHRPKHQLHCNVVLYSTGQPEAMFFEPLSKEHLHAPPLEVLNRVNAYSLVSTRDI